MGKDAFVLTKARVIKMKKAFLMSGCLLLMLSVFLCACGGTKGLSVENHVWKFSHVQGGADGTIIACPEETKDLYESARVLNLGCEAGDGVLTITNHDTQEQWKLTYRVNNTALESTIYDIAISGQSGHAALGVTKYADGSSEYTLILSIQGYSVYFTEEIEA